MSPEQQRAYEQVKGILVCAVLTLAGVALWEIAGLVADVRLAARELPLTVQQELGETRRAITKQLGDARTALEYQIEQARVDAVGVSERYRKTLDHRIARSVEMADIRAEMVQADLGEQISKVRVQLEDVTNRWTYEVGRVGALASALREHDLEIRQKTADLIDCERFPTACLQNRIVFTTQAIQHLAEAGAAELPETLVSVKESSRSTAESLRNVETLTARFVAPRKWWQKLWDLVVGSATIARAVGR